MSDQTRALEQLEGAERETPVCRVCGERTAPVAHDDGSVWLECTSLAEPKPRPAPRALAGVPGGAHPPAHRRAAAGASGGLSPGGPSPLGPESARRSVAQQERGDVVRGHRVRVLQLGQPGEHVGGGAVEAVGEPGVGERRRDLLHLAYPAPRLRRRPARRRRHPVREVAAASAPTRRTAAGATPVASASATTARSSAAVPLVYAA